MASFRHSSAAMSQWRPGNKLAYHRRSNYPHGGKHGQRSVTQQQGNEKAQERQEAVRSGRRFSRTSQERQDDDPQVLNSPEFLIPPIKQKAQLYKLGFLLDS
jgi:hypothetical protein